MAAPGTVRVDHAVTSGTFSLDGETHEVDNNLWVVGDDTECVVIDAPHSVSDILGLVGDRKVRAILCTHAHDDHVRVAPALREEVVAPIMLHPDDRPLWELTHPSYLWDVDLADGFEITVAGTTLRAGARVTLGRDASRVSQAFLRAIVAGLNSTGVHCEDLEVAPAPAVRFAMGGRDFEVDPQRQERLLAAQGADPTRHHRGRP